MKTLLTIIVLLVFIVLQNQIYISPLFIRNFVKGIFAILVGNLAFQFINGLLGGDKKRNHRN